MIKHYILIALRHLAWNKMYSGINLIGFSIGMACFILISLFVWDESQYDNFHEKADRIYRITPPNYARTAPKLAAALKEQIPEIEESIFLKGGSGVMRYENKQFFEQEILFVNPEILDVFTFNFKQGDPQTALDAPNAIVLTETMAEKYFGTREALGKNLYYMDTLLLNVSGVIEDWPSQSHIKNEGWISFETYKRAFNPNIDTWSNNIYYTYALLKEQVKPEVFDQKLQQFTASTLNVLANREDYKLVAQNLRDIHLQSDKSMELEVNGSLSQIYIFSSVAFFILLIAGINYVNLSTARSSRFAKEIGVRKTMGAQFKQLLSQFLGESVILSLISLIIAILMVIISLPAFNQLAEKNFQWIMFMDWSVVSILLGFAILVGLLGGGYPALVLSSFKPYEVLKGKLKKGGSQKLGLRNGLVVLQFAISLILLVGTLVVFQQIKFMKNQSLGYDKEQIMIVPYYWDTEVTNKFDLIKKELEANPGIEKVTASGDIPGRMATGMGYWVEGMEQDEWEGINALYVHDDFIQTYGMEMVSGRAFDPDIQTDADEGFIINESAALSIGWTPEEAIGKRFDVHKRGRILGVIKDFHFNSLHQEIEPLVIGVRPSWSGYLSIRANTADLSGIIKDTESKWTSLFPNRPFEYTFLDEDFQRHYLAETKLSKIASVFAFLAIMIACIGLFGLATFTCAQRKKEIAVRKVLGAQLTDIVRMLSGVFVRPILMAFIIAIPVGYYLLGSWLGDFAYQINIQWWWFAICGLILTSIAAFSVSIQSFKAAIDNPVKALKNE